MSEQVLITITGLKGEVLEDENVEMVVTGERYIKNDKIYIQYMDRLLDVDKETKTSIKIERDKVTIVRFGGVNTQIIFEKGVTHTMPYDTMLGVFEICTHTNEILLETDEDEMKLEVKYTIEIDKQSMGASSFSVKMKQLKES